jgi:Na+/H+ antiporter NhaD/arsenite permease-like protein
MSELLLLFPFVFLLTLIAVMPFINKHFWEKYYAHTSISLGLMVIAYYAVGLKDFHVLSHTGLEYLSFIFLIGSLFIVAGGIHIDVKGLATPKENIFLLSIGAILTNLIGTTGASMLLIRPFIRMNKNRIKPFHIVFFIFIVSNLGGSLTPIGDPPLFLGFLKGIPFFWVFEHIWVIWVIAMIYLLSFFYFFDSSSFRKLSKKAQARIKTPERIHVTGKRNFLLIGLILVAVFIPKPVFLRELLMLLAASLSLKLTPKIIHKQNEFNFHPIQEVAFLFFGIFATMIPALEYLSHHAQHLGINSYGQFYWATGILSAVLDNAPTYLSFLTTAFALNGLSIDQFSDVALMLSDPVRNHFVTGVSVAAVFFGAMTYIGNGPNFMVKAIAEHSKVKTPSFFGYIFRYALPILLPLLIFVWFIFFRG